MVFTILLGAAFVASAGGLWYEISRKLPALATVPEEVIAKRLAEDSARVRLFLLEAKTFYRERRHWKILLGSVGKILHRVHILLMRTDNTTVTIMRWIRQYRGETNGTENGSSVSPEENRDTGTTGENAVPSCSDRTPRSGTIQEIRTRRGSLPG